LSVLLGKNIKGNVCAINVDNVIKSKLDLGNLGSNKEETMLCVSGILKTAFI
jgi:hypothetical protein